MRKTAGERTIEFLEGKLKPYQNSLGEFSRDMNYDEADHVDRISKILVEVRRFVTEEKAGSDNLAAKLRFLSRNGEGYQISRYKIRKILDEEEAITTINVISFQDYFKNLPKEEQEVVKKLFKTLSEKELK